MERTDHKSNSGAGKAHGEKSGTFEGNFARLQEVVSRLSEGSLTLQEALSAYEEGMALADSCARMLDEAELRVSQVSERTMKASSAQSIQATEASSLSSANGEQNNALIAIEFDSIESTLVFDEPPAKNQQAAASKQEPPSQSQSQSQSAIRNPQSAIKLDPLFDDED